MCAGASATLDPKDPIVAALALDAPDVSSPWPYNYGESIGTPRYPGIPTQAEQRAAEWDLKDYLAEVERAKAATSKEAIAAINSRPSGLISPGRRRSS